MVIQKWNHTLQQLDIANQLFTEEDLEIAMSYLAQAQEADTLRSLNLSGTRITPPALRYSPLALFQSDNLGHMQNWRVYRSEDEHSQL